MKDSRAIAMSAMNVLGYQAVWFCCVLGAGSGSAWWGPAAALVFGALTLGLGGKARSDLRMLAVALPTGFAVDSAFAASGWMVYAQAWPWQGFAPAWIWALWAAFAMTLNHSMRFLQAKPWLSAAFGFVGGPLAYFAAARGFDAVEFEAPAGWVFLALALAWAAVLPMLFFLATRTTEPEGLPA